MQPVCRSLTVAALWLSFGLAALAVGDQPAALTSSVLPPGELGESLRNEVKAAIDRGVDWLLARQKADGAWSNSDFPALTALALEALNRARRPDATPAVDKAVAFILGNVREDGGIYKDSPGRKGGGLSNYNTAICMTALHHTGRPEAVRVVQNARAFVASSQHFGDDIYTGGFGYDKETKRAYTDLLNTYYAVTGMRETQAVEDQRPQGEKRVDIDWNATVKYIEKLQNKPETGEDNAGGFVYNPADGKAGTHTNAQGVVFFRSYGSITYAGLLAMIYAELKLDDPRVVSAIDWTSRHWTLEENPGMGAEGLFFFYSVLTKALSAAQRDMVPLENGTVLNWREQLARKLVSLQKIEADTGHGFWINEAGRYWESDPVLVTAYSLVALEML
jgi:squalene-hopene/tetraprenyl-beta-curcumene cyclase